MIVQVCKTDKELNNPIVEARLSTVRSIDGKVVINGVAYPYEHYFWINEGEKVVFVQE